MQNPRIRIEELTDEQLTDVAKQAGILITDNKRNLACVEWQQNPLEAIRDLIGLAEDVRDGHRHY
jgi:hypothetical protein